MLNTKLKEKSILSINLKLPDFTDFLKKSNEDTLNIKEKFNHIKSMSKMNNYWHERLYEENALILLSLGNVSQAVFDIQNKLEEIYTQKYINAPALAKMLYYKHYEKLHQPFSVLKNRCWRLFDELDNEYRRINKHNPPNWDDRLYRKKIKKIFSEFKMIANDIVNPENKEYDDTNDIYLNDTISEDLIEDINKINIPIVVSNEDDNVDILINDVEKIFNDEIDNDFDDIEFDPINEF